MRLRVVMEDGWRSPDVYNADTGEKMLRIGRIVIDVNHDGIFAYVGADGVHEIEFAQPIGVTSHEPYEAARARWSLSR